MDEPRDHTQALAGTALLIRLVDTGSISAAARSLGLPKSTVSRRLAAMEAEIGQPLLRRSTRAVSPTDLGRRLYEAAAPAIHAAWEAERAVREGSGRVAGTVTVSATAAYARHVLLPVLCAFMQDHAQVRVDLDVEEHRVDVVARAVDVAVRIGPLEDTALIARRIGTVRRRMVAAPDYVAAHGAPAGPADLAHHNAIVTSGALARRAFEDGTAVTVPWRMSAGTMELARDVTLQGFGIALLPDFLVADDLASGALVEVLPGHREPKVPIWALFAEASGRAPAVRALLDRLAQ